jgi:hypothetical protein
MVWDIYALHFYLYPPSGAKKLLLAGYGTV